MNSLAEALLLLSAALAQVLGKTEKKSGHTGGRLSFLPPHIPSA